MRLLRFEILCSEWIGTTFDLFHIMWTGFLLCEQWREFRVDARRSVTERMTQSRVPESGESAGKELLLRVEREALAGRHWLKRGSAPASADATVT